MITTHDCADLDSDKVLYATQQECTVARMEHMMMIMKTQKRHKKTRPYLINLWCHP